MTNLEEAALAQDIFLKLTGITGESRDDKHKNEIEVLRRAA
jgi:type VI protein secretion system component Hcp